MNLLMEKFIEIRKLVPANERNKSLVDAQFNYQTHLYFYQLQCYEPLSVFEFDKLFEEQYIYTKDLQFKCTKHEKMLATH
jgi:hypothetical protein